MPVFLLSTSSSSSLRDPFFAVEADCVLHREGGDHQSHAGKTDRSADIEEAISAAQAMHHRFPEQGEVPYGQQDAEFGGAEAPEGNAKFAEGVGCEIGLDGERQKSEEQAD